MKIRIQLFFCFVVTTSVYAQSKEEAQHRETFSENVFALTEVLFHDVVNPPAAARFYTYATLAAQHVCSESMNGPSLSRVVKNYPVAKSPKPGGDINPYFASIYAMLETGKVIIPSGYSLEEKQQVLYEKFSKQVDKAILDSSVAYAVRTAKLFIEASKKDGYFQLSVQPRYNPAGLDSTWYPTPPEYMAAVEPYWNTIRPMTLESADQFTPLPMVKFDVSEGSNFYDLMKDVYSVSKDLSEEQKLIANYWDCNPFANFYAGHVNVAIKKISPGGHWMNITGIACRTTKSSFVKTVYAHAIVAMGLHDGFISCWDEKFRSHRVRPKTVINKFLDERWNPLLETPPFPEYTSGHSVISTISATLLTFLFGDNVEFTDTTEVMFGLPARTFPSFNAAADEAAISRFYGGIHYMDAIENGQVQGRAIGNYIVERLQVNYADINR